MSLEVLQQAVDEFESKRLKNNIKMLLSDEALSEQEIYSRSLRTIEIFQKQIKALRIILSVMSLFLVPFIYFIVTKKPLLKFNKIEEGREDIEIRLSEGFKPLEETTNTRMTSPRKWAFLAKFLNKNAPGPADDASDDEEENPPEVLVLKEISKGGFGVVKKAVYRDANHQEQTVAIKMPCDKEKPSDQEVVNETLLDEANNLKKLDHPNIVTLIDSGNLNDGKFTLVLEYADHKSLHKFVYTSQYKSMTWDNRITIPVDIAMAIDYLHNTAKMLHRDLKGGNVLVFTDPFSRSGVTVKLCDFGLSVTQKKVKRKKASGTLNWLAPEALEAKINKAKGSQTTASDIWAFGLLLLIMAKRGDPFKSFDDAASLLAYFKEGGRKKIPEETPPEIKALIERCWRYKPEERPKIEEIRDELDKGVTIDL